MRHFSNCILKLSKIFNVFLKKFEKFEKRWEKWWKCSGKYSWNIHQYSTKISTWNPPFFHGFILSGFVAKLLAHSPSRSFSVFARLPSPFYHFPLYLPISPPASLPFPFLFLLPSPTSSNSTYSILFLCSEKTLRMNSPSSLGSNVDGTIQYTPGAKLNLELTSLKLIKEGERAQDALYLKKFTSNGFGRFSGSSN